MFGGAAFGQTYFGETLTLTGVVSPTRRFGHGGSGMSDEEYEALLRRMGAQHPSRVGDEELADALAAMFVLDLL